MNHDRTRMHELPKFDADYGLSIVLADRDLRNAIPASDEKCEIALACKRQLDTPHVHIMRERAYIALPHPKGEAVKGRKGKWAMMRFQLTNEARKRVIEVDTGTAAEGPLVVGLKPVKPSERYDRKAVKNKQFRKQKQGRKGNSGGRGGASADVLTAQGVRIFTGRSPR